MYCTCNALIFIIIIFTDLCIILNIIYFHLCHIVGNYVKRKGALFQYTDHSTRKLIGSFEGGKEREGEEAEFLYFSMTIFIFYSLSSSSQYR